MLIETRSWSKRAAARLAVNRDYRAWAITWQVSPAGCEVDVGSTEQVVQNHPAGVSAITPEVTREAPGGCDFLREIEEGNKKAPADDLEGSSGDHPGCEEKQDEPWTTTDPNSPWYISPYLHIRR